jgi:hypothetical protein
MKDTSPHAAIPQKLFYSVTKNLSSGAPEKKGGQREGDPTWPLFMANEYLQKNDPLRLALVQRAMGSVEDGPLPPRALQAACAGEKFSALEEDLQALVRSSRSCLKKTHRSIPKPRERDAPFLRSRRTLSKVNSERVHARRAVREAISGQAVLGARESDRTFLKVG